MNQIDAERAFGNEQQRALRLRAGGQAQLLEEDEERRRHRQHAQRRAGGEDGAGGLKHGGMPARQSNRHQAGKAARRAEQAARRFGQLPLLVYFSLSAFYLITYMLFAFFTVTI